MVILAWGLFFALILSFCTFPFALVVAAESHRHITVEFMLLAFLSGVVIFGMLGWLVVAMSNRAARIIQQRNQTGTSTNGGR